jgi:hypothetical protein
VSCSAGNRRRPSAPGRSRRLPCRATASCASGRFAGAMFQPGRMRGERVGVVRIHEVRPGVDVIPVEEQVPTMRSLLKKLRLSAKSPGFRFTSGAECRWNLPFGGAGENRPGEQDPSVPHPQPRPCVWRFVLTAMAGLSDRRQCRAFVPKPPGLFRARGSRPQFPARGCPPDARQKNQPQPGSGCSGVRRRCRATWRGRGKIAA